MKIANREIGDHASPFVIAEVSGNHNGSIKRAKEIILAAKNAGAHAVKLQTYNADTMTIDTDLPDFMIKGGLWGGYSLYDLYKEACTPFEWQAELFKYARSIGIIIFSSPFDETAIDLLESLEAPAYKIASFEFCDIPLIKYAARLGKPLLMSTGLASESDIGDALEAARSAGAQDILLFHCISSYPTPIEQSNLRNIQYLKSHFDVKVGLSDHTMGTTAAVASIALGAVAIEKHFTLSRQDKGPDSAFSLEPHELTDLVTQTADAWSALGNPGFNRADVEKSNLIFKRSIYFVEDLAEGAEITKTAIRRIRPGYGLAPKYFDELVGRKVSKAVRRGEPVSWDVLK
ncbi:MAG: pseudaminic acid synthase [Pseudomonadota bacterium]|nr:pseudaminic acid synthase [Pseudomonadota bacterium]